MSEASFAGSGRPSPTWDHHQEKIIRAPADARRIVDAGPGTGKTEVACARVASLIDRGVEPVNIWLISFTRTAVREITDRIAQFAETADRAREVRIATLDSTAWHLRAGFDAEGRDSLFRGFTENIESTLEMLRKDDPAIMQYFSSIEHLVVDEAQDLVGVRAMLVEAIVELLPASSGVTVFTDDAQAIYGFAEQESPESVAGGLSTRMRDRVGSGFKVHELREVYRTDSPGLRKIFTVTRRLVVDPGANPEDRLEQVVEQIRNSADGDIGTFLANTISGKDDTLVLFRRRIEVLTASSFLRSEGIIHRLRMSGLPTVCAPWVAAILWDLEEPRLARSEFIERFIGRVADRGAISADDAWLTLFRLAGEPGGRLDLRRLRQKIGRDRPPPDLTFEDCGSSGPILGTIHASKGREAPSVHLMLPAVQTTEGDLDEEARVMFVGATRPQKVLNVGMGFATIGSAVDGSGRVYSFARKKKTAARVEFGRAGDVDRSRQVSESLFDTRQEVLAAQEILMGFDGTPLDVVLVSNPDRNYQMEIRVGGEEGQLLGVMAHGVNSDLFSIGRHLSNARNVRRKLRPLPKVNHCRLIGTSTHVIREDEGGPPLHAPWDESRTFLVPVISGFSMVNFRGYR